jgi:hypothetical protein
LASAQLSYQEWAKSLLAHHFRGLWSFAECYDALEQIIREHGRSGNWLEIWISIKETLAFDRDRNTPELLARLESLESLTAPFDLCSNIEAYALVNTWDHIKFDGKDLKDESDEIYEKVIKLGELTASQQVCLDRLGAKLWQTHVQPLFWLGKGLATGAVEKFSMFDFLVDSFQRHRPNHTNALLLEGYISGIYDSDPHQGRQILERALEIPELKFDAVRLILTVPISSWTLLKLLNFARGGELEAWRFEQISYGRVHEAIPDEDLADLLAEINKLDRGYTSTIRIMSMRLFEKEKNAYTPSTKLCTVARTAILRLVSAHREELSQARLHRINSVLDEAFNTSAPESEVKEVIDLLCAGIRNYRLYALHLTDVITVMVSKYPEWLLDAVFDGSEKEETLAFLLFRDRMSREGGTLNDAPLERVLAWCGNDQERITKVAKSVRAYSANGATDALDENPKRMVLSTHIKSLFTVAQDKLAMIEVIFKNSHPGSWSGSLADILEVRAKAFAELLEHSDPKIQALVRTKLTLFEQRIRNEREREAAEHNEREQRFE